jgi:hypothetical protein
MTELTLRNSNLKAILRILACVHAIAALFKRGFAYPVNRDDQIIWSAGSDDDREQVHLRAFSIATNHKGRAQAISDNLLAA